jgi:hypothetical protein
VEFSRQPPHTPAYAFSLHFKARPLDYRTVAPISMPPRLVIMPLEPSFAATAYSVATSGQALRRAVILRRVTSTYGLQSLSRRPFDLNQSTHFFWMDNECS